MTHMWRAEGRGQQSGPFFHHEVPGDQTQARLGSKGLYPLSHLVGLTF